MAALRPSSSDSTQGKVFQCITNKYSKLSLRNVKMHVVREAEEMAVNKWKQ